MRRPLLISLALVLVLVGWSAVGADDGFYVIPAMKGNYAPVPKTGQTTSYDTRDDGDLEKGVVWPTPRFTDHGNGTVTDNLTGLIWTQNADAFGLRTWAQALSDANGLHDDGLNDLKDGSVRGDWRLPSIRELQSLVDYGRTGSALPWPNPFIGDHSGLYYWSSTTSRIDTTYAWCVYFGVGFVDHNVKTGTGWVWCVRGGK